MIVELTPRHAIEVAFNMRDIDRREVLSSCRSKTPLEFAKECLYHGGFAVLDSTGKAVCVGGVAYQWEGVGNAWMVGTDAVYKHMIEVTRLGIKLVNDKNLRRVQAWSAAFHTDSHKWLSRIGFVEAHKLKSWGRNGEDFILFEKFND